MRSLPSFEEVLATFAEQTIATQQQLDERYLKVLKDYSAFVPTSALSGLFQPSRVVVDTESIELQFSSDDQSMQRIQVMNQVISKRYQSQHLQHSVRMEVRRNPIGPGQTMVPPRS